IQGRRCGCPQFSGNRLGGGQRLLLVIRMIREGIAHNQATLMFNCGLNIVRLFKAFVVAIFHHARFWVSEVILLFLLRTWFGWCRRTSPAFLAGLLLLCLATSHFAFVLGLLFSIAFLPSRFQHGLGLGKTSRFS